MLLSYTHGWHGRWQLPINLSWCTLQNKSNKERKFIPVNHSTFAALSFKVKSIICWFVSVGMNLKKKSKALMLYKQYLNGIIVPLAIFFSFLFLYMMKCHGLIVFYQKKYWNNYYHNCLLYLKSHCFNGSTGRNV